MPFHVEYQFYSSSVKQYLIPLGVAEYSSTNIYAVSAYCSAAAQNIEMGWFRYSYDGYVRDKKQKFLN